MGGPLFVSRFHAWRAIVGACVAVCGMVYAGWLFFSGTPGALPVLVGAALAGRIIAL